MPGQDAHSKEMAQRRLDALRRKESTVQAEGGRLHNVDRAEIQRLERGER